MRKIIFSLAILGFLACNDAAKQTASTESNNKATNTAAPDKTVPVAGNANLIGNWVGYLGDNKLNVQLQTINGTAVEGRSVAAGNYRLIKGTVEETADMYKLHLQEPGDDKYDGVFDITIKKQGMVCEGNWQPFDETLQTKTFTLAKKEFTYQPGSGDYPEASQKELKEEDVLNYVKEDLRVMRNSIYARHGYSFKMKDMRATFDKQDWYMPMSTDVRGELTAIEKKNESLLKRMEKYAATYYDSYGR